MRWLAAALVLAACGGDSALPPPDANNHLGTDATVDAPLLDAPIADAAAPNVLFRDMNSHPMDLAIDSEYVYWTDRYYPGRVNRTSITTRQTETLFDQQGQHVDQIAIDDTTLYWTGDLGLQSAPKSGGVQPTMLHALVGGPLAADTNALYVVDATGVVRVPKVGGTAQTISSDPALSIVTGAFGLVWSTATSIERLAPGTTIADTLATGLNQVVAIGADDTHAYFVESAASRIGSVGFVDHAIASLYIFTTFVGSMPRVFVSGSGLYFADASTVYRLARSGGAATPIADRVYRNGVSIAIVADAANVFWAEATLGGKFSELGAIAQLPQ